jgi:hypothetical protein
VADITQWVSRMEIKFVQSKTMELIGGAGLALVGQVLGRLGEALRAGGQPFSPGGDTMPSWPS